MKALTIQQPYASLVANGNKFVENRKWSTRYRGPLAIHAGRGTLYLSEDQLNKHPSGCVIAVAELVNCLLLATIKEYASNPNTRNNIIPGASLSWDDVYSHHYTEGPVCWILENVKPIQPHVPTLGAQRLWDWVPPGSESKSMKTSDLLSALEAAVEIGTSSGALGTVQIMEAASDKIDELSAAARKVIHARNSNGSWDNLNDAITELEESVGR